MKRTPLVLGALCACFILAIWTAGQRACLAVDILVELDSALDRFGSQIETVQVYEDASGQRVSYGIYDTGASPITWSAYDQAFHIDFPEYAGPPIPIKVAGGAGAEGIGGSLTGDVSEPGTIRAAGIDAVSFDEDFNMTFNLDKAAFVPGDPDSEHGVQVFVGTETGSPYLPTITGTPIHHGRLPSYDPSALNGVAAKIDMQWDQFDLGALLSTFDETLGAMFAGITITQPNVEFAAPGTRLQAVLDDELTELVDESTFDPVRIPLTLGGVDNHEDPGDMITVSYNPFQNTGVLLSEAAATIGDDPSDRLVMLADTGAQLSIISVQMATDLGFDLNAPEFTAEVQGAAGGVGVIPGFTIDSLELPTDSDFNGTVDSKVRLTNVPVFVFDVVPADGDPEQGLDGILGMNLFNTASGLLYDPFDPLGPSLSVTFLRNPYREDLGQDLLAELQGDMALPDGLDLDLADLDSLAGEVLIAWVETLALLEDLGYDLSDLGSGDLEALLGWPEEFGDLGLDLGDFDTLNLEELIGWLDTVQVLEGWDLDIADLSAMDGDATLGWLDGLMVSAEQLTHAPYPRFALPIDGSNMPSSWAPGGVVPEPSTWALLATAGLVLLGWRPCRRRAA